MESTFNTQFNTWEHVICNLNHEKTQEWSFNLVLLYKYPCISLNITEHKHSANAVLTGDTNY